MTHGHQKDDETLQTILGALDSREITLEAATQRIKALKGFVSTPDATTDTDRVRRRGIPEVVYGEGKTSAQVIEILKVLQGVGQMGLVTRLDPVKAGAVCGAFPGAVYDERAQCLSIGALKARPQFLGEIAVVSAGTSDLGVAAETVFCLRAFGNDVSEFRDVGVSGLHRLMEAAPSIAKAQVVITIAGFEAALPTVLSGLIDRPILAVPTSVGYGASFGGVTALLGMLNACAPGITVLNIDNGFGAAYAATLMNQRPRHL